MSLTLCATKVDMPVEILINNVHDPISAQRELPVAGHDIDTQQLAGVDHVLTLRPQRRGRALPQVPAIEEQCARSICPEPLDQGGDVGKAPGAPKLLRRGDIVQVTQRMCRL